ncbi:hypothetical protein ABZX51_009526 [Aspergillus tubingensis]
MTKYTVPHKWIKQIIDSLDLHVDYEEILLGLSVITRKTSLGVPFHAMLGEKQTIGLTPKDLDIQKET